MHVRQLIVMGAAGAALAAGACVRPPPPPVRVPPDVLRGSQYTAEGEPARARYVVRMTDGERDWEIQLPEIATAYEVKVPLKGKPASPLAIDMATLTAADREMLQDRDASQRAADVSGRPDDDADEAGAGGGGKARGGRGARRDEAGQARGPTPAGPARPGAAAATPVKGSYLLTLARVKELYRTRHYELALVELVALEQQYPGDERILSMKGSLYERMGNKGLARQAWQEALNLNPFNLAILEALQRLGK